jgi:2,3-bisphosphoglycerate-independent phosphoglycerate mutase
MIKTSSKTNGSKKPTVLLILDGWGMAEPSEANAIEQAKKPTFDYLWKNYPHTILQASGKDVGLPPGQAGNSEAGHINIGAGRVVDQESVVISKSINNGKFFKNPAFEAAHKHITEHKSNLHIFGLLSNGQSPHSDPDHLLALISWCRQKKIKDVYLHLFTDGRDSPPHSSLKLMEALMRVLKNTEKNGVRHGEWIATVTGRLYAMDRKKEWSRTQATYEAMVLGKGRKAKSPQEAITQSYNRGESDEYIPPYVITRGGKPITTIKDNDAIIFYNSRSDRARQLAKPFVQDKFNALNPGSFVRRKVPKNLLFVAMTDFGPDLDSILTAYPSVDLKNTLPMVIGKKKQLYIAENEKYAHVTFFMNGGYADKVAGEDRVLVPSPSFSHYDEAPEMSVKPITKKVISVLDKYDFIAINFSIPDMVAHTGNIKACVKSVEAIDKCLKDLYDSIKKRKGRLLITADHGNADMMLNLETNEMITEHSTNPVPFILVDQNLKKGKLKKGRLADIAPTILKLMKINKPKEMTGKPLF